LRPPAAASAASRRVLNPSFPHSLDHARASTVAISLRSSINPSRKITLVAKTKEAVDAAVAESRAKNAPLFCTGSFYLVAEARRQIMRTEQD
jgi:folylpolyglutamate synthase/dihydropteroate synthase